MFTGIVQGVGQVVAINQQAADFRTHIVKLPETLGVDLKIGASIANNGCCLTISYINGLEVGFDLMQETLKKTNLGLLKVGDGVNIERAARFGDEIGGHVMSGHITTVIKISQIEHSEYNCSITFELPEKIKPYILTKGFVGLDGCSLTIGDVTENEFNVHLIPETLNKTLFGHRQLGDKINLEIDPQTQAIVDTVNSIIK